jgi:TM2 domain-containing membrane protein YozV
MYYCKNCGEAYMTDEAVMCVKCGVSRGQGSNYCHNCGKPMSPQANVCLTCGVAAMPMVNGEAKSKIAAGLFGIFLGCFGVHNFYLGYTSKAVTQLVLTIVSYPLMCLFGLGVLLLMGISIWGLVEGIMILVGKINVDAKGIPLKD